MFFFILLSNVCCLFQLQKTPDTVFFYRFLKAGSGFRVKKATGSGSALLETAGFGYANKKNADPHP